MSQFVKKPQVGFTIKDTEFLLRLINMSNIPGGDVMQCSDTMKKLEEKHKELMSKEVGV